MAAALASGLPLTLAAMSAGDLDSWRAAIIASELCEAGGQSCAVVETLIFPAVLGEAPGAVTKRVRRVLARVDADAVRVKAAKERLDRFVHAYPCHVPGLTTWVASLPAADSAACWAAIDDPAHRMHGDDPSTRIARVLLDERTGVVDRDQHRAISPREGDAPVHPETRPALPLPRLRAQRQTLRARPCHPVLPQDRPRSGTLPVSANTTTGSNTRPAGP